MKNLNKQCFTIRGKLPDLNDYTNKCRSHWSKGNEMKKAVENDIGWQIKIAKLNPVDKPVILIFYWYESNWKRDADNVAFAKKFICDALVSQGILPNDNRKENVIGFFDCFPDPTKEPHVVVDIRELPWVTDMTTREQVVSQIIQAAQSV